MKWLESLFSTRPDTPTRHPHGTVQEANDPRGSPVSAKGMFVCSGVHADTVGLYLVDQRGEIAAELARANAGESLGQFAVSPDARWVAYTCNIQRNENADSYPLIRSVPTAGGPSTDLTPWDAQYETCYQNPVFSPQGDKIVCEFALQHPYNPDLKVFELFSLGDRLAKSGTLSIINPLHIGNHAPIFAPDGERIIYFGNFAYEDLLEVCLYDPSIAEHELLGAVAWRLTENADGVWRRPRAIAVQPEWEQIFFIQGHTRRAERICLFLLSDLSPGSHRKVFDSVGKEHNRIGALAISHDGLRLAYDGDGAVYVIGTDGAGLRQVSPDGMNCRCPRFSEDGARLAYVGDGKLCIADLDSGKSATLTGDELRLDQFAWT